MQLGCKSFIIYKDIENIASHFSTFFSVWSFQILGYIISNWIKLEFPKGSQIFVMIFQKGEKVP